MTLSLSRNLGDNTLRTTTLSSIERAKGFCSSGYGFYSGFRGPFIRFIPKA